MLVKNRTLDLRRPEMQNNLRLKSKLTKAIRDYLESESYMDIETPILTKATPEGARDYLVPSRTSPGNFFALPQSPQLFKQMLMVSGSINTIRLLDVLEMRILEQIGSLNFHKLISKLLSLMKLTL